MGQIEEKKKEDVDGGKKRKEEVLPVVVFKVDVNCDRSASEIKRCVENFQGVKKVKVDRDTNQLRVTGNVNPCKLRDHVKAKTGKTINIISPVKPPKKEIGGGGKKPSATGRSDSKDKKKSKEVATAVELQIRTEKFSLQFKGVQKISVNDQKNLVTAKETIDVNSLATYLLKTCSKFV